MYLACLIVGSDLERVILCKDGDEALKVCAYIAEQNGRTLSASNKECLELDGFHDLDDTGRHVHTLHIAALEKPSLDAKGNVTEIRQMS